MVSDPAPRAGEASIVPDAELVFRASRSGGPGGQHVNRSATRVEVRWNVRRSSALTDDQRKRLLDRLGRRVDRAGWLRVVSDRSRSQHANRADAVAKLREQVRRALVVPRARRPTSVPRGERERRLAEKRRRAALKRERRARDDEH
jgi:ribosome-associated protein